MPTKQIAVMSLGDLVEEKDTRFRGIVRIIAPDYVQLVSNFSVMIVTRPGWDALTVIHKNWLSQIWGNRP